MRFLCLGQLALALMACADAAVSSQQIVHRHVAVLGDAAASSDVDVDSSAPTPDTDVALDVADITPDIVDTEPSGPELDDTSVPDTIDIAAPDTVDIAEPEALDTVALETLDTQAPPEVVVAACPDDMRALDASCIDRWEAPNIAGERPLVMYTFNEAEAWCGARDKRLCFDDEWRSACAGASDLAYPYGAQRVAGRCNDDKLWRAYTQSLLNGWPASASAPDVGSLDALMQAVRSRGTNATAAADHVLALYQGTAAGERPACVGAALVEDLVGNVEEWVRRRDGGDGPQFSGALVGRYWAESRTCQSRVTVHGNTFRFYEIGFRCCREKVQR